MTLFDAYIFIDWSAVNTRHPRTPRKDAVWTGESIPAIRQRVETYHRTRQEGISHTLDFVLRCVRDGQRVLVGFDFPYGYPRGFTNALGIEHSATAWSHVWSEIAGNVQDCANNHSNRFEAAALLNARVRVAKHGPFWGCPAEKQISPNLNSRSPGFPFQCGNGTVLPRLRLAEERLKGTQESWKLFGAGSVGSQALVGIPYVHQLRNHANLKSLSKVWPFETQFTNVPSPERGPFILHAEIWPSVIREQAQALQTADPQLIPDQAQVRAMCEWASVNDQQGDFGQFFATPVGLIDAEIQICTEQEGWILGAR